MRIFSFRYIFGIDLRSLALWRIGLGLVLFADLVKRALALTAHYTDQGVLPRFVVNEFYRLPFFSNLFMLNGETWATAVLFIVAGVLTLFLTLGFCTQIVSLLLFAFWSSLDARNPLVLHTGDMYLRALLFWSLFVPLAGRFSLDRIFSQKDDAVIPPRVISVGTVALLLQIAFFYVMAGIFKWQVPEWRSGEALGIFLQLDAYVEPFGRMLRHFPQVMQGATWGTLFIECIAPWLLFVPIFTPIIRLVMLGVFLIFHSVIELSIHVGLFHVMSVAALCCFIPTEVWDFFEKKISFRIIKNGKFLPRPRLQLTRAAAGMCGLCLLYVIVSNINSIAPQPMTLIRPLDRLGKYVGLDQKWSMFSRLADLNAGHVVIIGETLEGHIVDVIPHQPFKGWDPPVNFSATFINHNWRRYWMHLMDDAYQSYRPYGADYFCRQWAQTEPAEKRLKFLSLIEVAERFAKDGQKTLSQRRTLLDYRCPVAAE